MIESLNDVARVIHADAVVHGWWETERELPEILMLCVSELAEALEEYRNRMPVEYYKCNHGRLLRCAHYQNGACLCSKSDFKHELCPHFIDKPEGVGIELADCIIRILDFCAWANIDIDDLIVKKMEYNRDRPWKHGGKVC